VIGPGLLVDLPWACASAVAGSSRGLHSPELLILDEPTSGWTSATHFDSSFAQLLLPCPREDGVTIFIFQPLYERGESAGGPISLMHAGEVLACDTPAGLGKSSRVEQFW